MLTPLLLAGTAIHPNWTLSRALEWRPLRWIGRISYSLYLWQQIFLIAGWNQATHAWQRWPWNLAATFAVATASYFMMERPLQLIGRQLADRLRLSAHAPIESLEIGYRAPVG